MPTALQRGTWSNNIQFLCDPERFFRETLVDSVSMLEKSMALNKVNAKALQNNCTQIFDFDLVPVGYRKCCLVMRHPKSDYVGGPSIKARFLGFAFNVSGASEIARIDAPGDGLPIFTVGITGCTIIGIRGVGGLRFFHEPTRQDRRLAFLKEYPGQVVIHAPSSTGYGTAFMSRVSNTWRVTMQSFRYDLDAWTEAAHQDAVSTKGQSSSKFFNFYSHPTVTVHEEGSTHEVLRTALLSRRAAMGYDD